VRGRNGGGEDGTACDSSRPLE